MRIGYPCINWSIGCRGDKRFMLKSWSEDRFHNTLRNNLDCLETMLRYNVEKRFLYFRISSNLVPFASHPVCSVDWPRHYADRLAGIGSFIRKHHIRIAMHPDPFTLINSPDTDVFQRSRKELAYHAAVLDGMELGPDARIQIHVGGAYGDPESSISRFVTRFHELQPEIRNRLAVEHDDRIFSVSDCIHIHEKTGVPVVFDNLHHELNGNGQPTGDALVATARTWGEHAGPPLVDYSMQAPWERPGRHAAELEPDHFSAFLKEAAVSDMDIMLEIKGKERAADAALRAAADDPRLVNPPSGPWRP